MTPSDLLGAFITGVLAVAIISLVVAPGNDAGKVIESFGSSFTSIISAAKAYPTK